MCLIRCIVAVFIAHGVAASHGYAQQEWVRFRGPNGTGVVEEAELPTKWQQPKWSVRLAGVGSSSPVAWGDRIFVTSCDMKTAAITIECLSRTDGQRQWAKSFDSKSYKLHGRNTYAASTPAVDADHIYVCYANPDETFLVALDHSGTEVWRRDFGRWVSSHGFGTSPIVYEDLVIFCNSQSAEELDPGVEPGQSRLLAVRTSTGEDAWSLDLTTRRVCYSVPCLGKDPAGNDAIFNCNTGDGFYSVDPETGSMNRAALPFKMRTVASPLLVDGLLIGSCGSGGGGNYLVAMRPDGLAKETTDELLTKPVYQVRGANYVACPIAVNDCLFLFNDKGIAQCVDLRTGKLHWKERLSSGFSASPVANQSQIYTVDEGGVVYVVAASPEFKLVGKQPLGESTRATPMIVGDQIFFRTRSQLICVGERSR